MVDFSGTQHKDRVGDDSVQGSSPHLVQKEERKTPRPVPQALADNGAMAILAEARWLGTPEALGLGGAYDQH